MALNNIAGLGLLGLRSAVCRVWNSAARPWLVVEAAPGLARGDAEEDGGMAEAVEHLADAGIERLRIAGLAAHLEGRLAKGHGKAAVQPRLPLRQEPRH